MNRSIIHKIIHRQYRLCIIIPDLYNVKEILLFWLSFLIFTENNFSFGNSAKESFAAVPVLHFLLIDLCPKTIEFWVPCVSKYVGFSFCPFAALNWQKWFSTTSWFKTAGLMTDPGNRFSFSLTSEIIPKIIACKSNQSFEERNSLFFETLSFHLEKYANVERKLWSRVSLISYIACLLEKNSTIKLVCCKNVMLPFSLDACSGFPEHSRWLL